MTKELDKAQPAVSLVNCVKIGGIVTRTSITFFGFESKQSLPRTGTVIYIHPKGRYHVVEFTGKSGTIREAFHGVTS